MARHAFDAHGGVRNGKQWAPHLQVLRTAIHQVQDDADLYGTHPTMNDVAHRVTSTARTSTHPNGDPVSDLARWQETAEVLQRTRVDLWPAKWADLDLMRVSVRRHKSMWDSVEPTLEDQLLAKAIVDRSLQQPPGTG